MSQRIVLSIAIGVVLAACGEPPAPEEASAPGPVPTAAAEAASRPGAKRASPFCADIRDGADARDGRAQRA